MSNGSDDDIIIQHHYNGADHTPYSCSKTAAQAAYDWITTHSPPSNIATFITGDIILDVGVPK